MEMFKIIASLEYSFPSPSLHPSRIPLEEEAKKESDPAKLNSLNSDDSSSDADYLEKIEKIFHNKCIEKLHPSHTVSLYRY